MTLDVDRFISGLHAYLGKALKPLSERLAAVEARMAELEKSPVRYEGPHEQGKTHTKRAFASLDGVWHCKQKTTSRPGDAPAWTLALKRARDGKDAR